MPNMPALDPLSPSMPRRRALCLGALLPLGGALAACGSGHAAQPGADAPQPVQQALARFAALAPETSGALVRSHAWPDAEAGTAGWQAAHAPERTLFTGSATKSFMLAEFLRRTEAAQAPLSADAPCVIDDGVRSPSSAVFANLNGHTPYRSVLEAMITHSDNTATDAVLAAVRPDAVRALIAQAGLASVQIPDSTRKLFSCLAGAPSGTDLGWEGMQRLERDEDLGLTPLTDPSTAPQTMIGSAEDMVRWYEGALAGRWFAKADTLREFRRIQAMANALALVMPPGLAAYGKGGSIDWEGFHALCLPGQMVVGRRAVSFCFTLNWRDGLDSVQRLPEFVGHVAPVLQAAADALAA